MKAKLEKLNPAHVRLTITVAGADLVHYFDHSLEELGKQVQLPGFRPGTAPRALLLEHLGYARVEQNALQHAIPQSYYRAVKEHSLQAVQQPSVSIKEHGDYLEGKKDLIFIAEVDILPPVTVTGWETIRLPKAKPLTADEKEVEQALAMIQKQRATHTPVERPAQTGDQVEISFSGTVDSKPHEALQSKHYPVVIGTNVLVPGFENELIGMKKGEEKTFSVTFPKDYPHAEFREKKAQFQVTMERVQEVGVVPVDDELAKTLGAKTVSELKERLRTQLINEKKMFAEHKDVEFVLDKLAQKTKAALPESFIEHEKNRLRERLLAQLASREQTLEHYLSHLKKTQKEFEQDLYEQAQRNTKVGLALRFIAEKAKIKLEKDGDAQKVIEYLLKRARKM